MSVVVRSLQAAVLALSSREISQSVRIDHHSFPSRVRISVWRRKFVIGKKPKRMQKPATIITGPTFMGKRLRSFIDDFALNGYLASR